MMLKQIQKAKEYRSRRPALHFPRPKQKQLHNQTERNRLHHRKQLLLNKQIMNRYIGKKCPYCKTELKQTDDIVLCSACRMPHHKDCWIANNGCTTFGCLGTIDRPNPQEDEPEDTCEILLDDEIVVSYVYCPCCGERNSYSNNFCTNCGYCLSV